MHINIQSSPAHYSDLLAFSVPVCSIAYWCLKPGLNLNSHWQATLFQDIAFSVVIVLVRGVLALVGNFAADSGSQSSASLKIPSVTGHRQGHRNLLKLTLDDNLKSATLTFLFNIATPGLPSSVFKSVSVDL